MLHTFLKNFIRNHSANIHLTQTLNYIHKHFCSKIKSQTMYLLQLPAPIKPNLTYL